MDRETSIISLKERWLPLAGSEEPLSKWLGFSLLLHAGLIGTLFLLPFLPSQTRSSYPIYSVDLVGGEQIGRTNFGTELKPTAPPTPEVKTPEAKSPPAAEEAKHEIKKEKAEKPKTVEKAPLAQEKTTMKEITKNEPRKTANESANEAKPEATSLDSVRERLLQSAVERAKTRTEVAAKPSKGESLSVGAGEGQGAASLGPGQGRGGNVVRGVEFILYHNKMVSVIKENWAWAGQKGTLKVVVHFSIKESGEIIAVKVLQPSGDPSYDESVLRAVRKSSPLPPPPESYRKDFSDVELTFRP